MGRYLCGLRIFNLGNQPYLLEGPSSGSRNGNYFTSHRLVLFFAGAVDYFDAALARIYRCFKKYPHVAHSFIDRFDCGWKLAVVYLGG